MSFRWSVAPAVAAVVLASVALAAPADAVGPTVDSLQISRDTVYPVVDGYQDTVTVSGTATGATTVHIDVSTSESDATQALRVDATPDGGGNFQATLGQNLLGHVANGTYYVWARPDDGDLTVSMFTTVTVSLKHLVTKTWQKTVTAAGSKLDKYVGACSTLRKPSLRGWAGSLGYYSNTRCRKTVAKSVVVSVHGLVLPAVSSPGSYGTVRIAAYGGAAKKKPRSHAYLAYLSPDASAVVAFPTLGPRVGTHNGPTVAASRVRNGRSILWGATVRSGSRYDIKNFTVTLTYKALQ